MTFQNYKCGLVTYYVCTCRAFNVRPFEHNCNGAYTRFLVDCACPLCKGYRTWTAGNQSSPS